MDNNYKGVAISVVNGDVTSFNADVLVIKYAQAHYGLDGVVSEKVTSLGIDESQLSPTPGTSSYFYSCGGIKATAILVMGVAKLYEFNYKDIRIFARSALEALVDYENDAPIEHVCFTLHGAEFGLDEVEAFESEVAGLIDGITAGRVPKSVQRISIVEIDDRRANRLKNLLRELIPLGHVEANLTGYLQASEGATSGKFRSVGYPSADSNCSRGWHHGLRRLGEFAFKWW